MIIIADSGATKTEWALIDSSGIRSIYTQGINPYHQDSPAIEQIIQKELLPQTGHLQPKALYFYGAGISTEGNINMVGGVLRKFFNGHIEVDHDLLGAARALCERNQGIACILGTGSNSALYNGKEITHNIKSGGFILSDEGSAAHIGKILARDYIYGRIPEDMRDLFKHDAEEIIDHLYRKPVPNRFIASLAVIAGDSIDHPYSRSLVRSCFDEFLELRVLPYSKSREIPVSFIGSVAETFAPMLKEALAEKQLTFGHILKAPMEGLIKFHLNEKH